MGESSVRPRTAAPNPSEQTWAPDQGARFSMADSLLSVTLVPPQLLQGALSKPMAWVSATHQAAGLGCAHDQSQLPRTHAGPIESIPSAIAPIQGAAVLQAGDMMAPPSAGCFIWFLQVGLHTDRKPPNDCSAVQELAAHHMKRDGSGFVMAVNKGLHRPAGGSITQL